MAEENKCLEVKKIFDEVVVIPVNMQMLEELEKQLSEHTKALKNLKGILKAEGKVKNGLELIESDPVTELIKMSVQAFSNLLHKVISEKITTEKKKIEELNIEVTLLKNYLENLANHYAKTVKQLIPLNLKKGEIDESKIGLYIYFLWFMGNKYEQTGIKIKVADVFEDIEPVVEILQKQGKSKMAKIIKSGNEFYNLHCDFDKIYK